MQLLGVTMHVAPPFDATTANSSSRLISSPAGASQSAPTPAAVFRPLGQTLKYFLVFQAKLLERQGIAPHTRPLVSQHQFGAIALTAVTCLKELLDNAVRGCTSCMQLWNNFTGIWRQIIRAARTGTSGIIWQVLLRPCLTEYVSLLQMLVPNLSASLLGFKWETKRRLTISSVGVRSVRKVVDAAAAGTGHADSGRGNSSKADTCAVTEKTMVFHLGALSPDSLRLRAACAAC